MAKQNQLYVRRCHRCAHITAGGHVVDRCAKCDKPFARFFYFDDQYVTIESDSEYRAPLLPGEMRPIRGISVCWLEWTD